MYQHYLLTINHPTKTEDEMTEYVKNLPNIKYAVFQKEEGHNSVEHYQMYLYFDKHISLQSLKSYFKTAHIEFMRGNSEAARNYCMKTKTRKSNPIEIGTFIKNLYNTRNNTLKNNTVYVVVSNRQEKFNFNSIIKSIEDDDHIFLSIDKKSWISLNNKLDKTLNFTNYDSCYLKLVNEKKNNDYEIGIETPFYLRILEDEPNIKNVKGTLLRIHINQINKGEYVKFKYQYLNNNKTLKTAIKLGEIIEVTENKLVILESSKYGTYKHEFYKHKKINPITIIRVSNQLSDLYHCDKCNTSFIKIKNKTICPTCFLKKNPQFSNMPKKDWILKRQNNHLLTQDEFVLKFYPNKK